MSTGDERRRTTALIADLEALLERVANAPLARRPLAVDSTMPATSWQNYASELRDLCQRVLEEADEETAVAFWVLLIETAARHGRHARRRPA
jgi:hypothetical protein